ncbi:MAG: alpha/beta hydrolase [Cyclobacteriaceae bacterium]
MQSYQHRVLKAIMNTLSLPMNLMLPPVDHLRSLLESLTLVSTLPWDVHFQEVDHGAFRSDWIMPSNVVRNRALLYLHGGGYVIGSPRTHRGLAGKIAKGIQANCLLPDYRKAPEFPFPYALSDAFVAYRFLIDTGYAASDIIVAGDSAGGGLSMALIYKIRDAGMTLPRAVVLLSPYVDLVNGSASRAHNALNDRFLDIFEMRRWAKLYAPDQDLFDPYISPIYGDMHNFPPMLIQASNSEVLIDDALGLFNKAREAGVNVQLQTWESLVHWWHMFGALPEAKDAIGKIIDFLNERYTMDNQLSIAS